MNLLVRSDLLKASSSKRRKSSIEESLLVESGQSFLVERVFEVFESERVVKNCGIWNELSVIRERPLNLKN